MDPNEALRLIRAYIKQMAVEDRPVGNANARIEFVQHARDLAETVEGLDEWLSKDGFLPTDWMAEEDKPQPERPYQKGDRCRLLGDLKVEHWDCDEHRIDGTITRLGVVISTPKEQA